MSNNAANIAQLRELTATPLDSNNLGVLAKLHTGCQTLLDIDGGVGQLAATVANFLEAVILKEAADPAGGLLLIPDAIKQIEAILGGATADCAELRAKIREATSGGATTGSAAAAAKPATAPKKETAPTPAPAKPTPTPPAVAPVATSQPAATPTASPSATVEVEEYVAEPLNIDMSERDHLQGFVDEAREHMDAIEAALLEVEREPSDTAKIDELFRPFHTIKGIAGFLNLRDINRLTHEVETILDMGRKNEMPITPVIVDLIFAGIDSLKTQMRELGNYIAAPTGGPVTQPDIRDIMRRLRTAAKGGAVAPATPSPKATAVASEPKPVQPASAPEQPVAAPTAPIAAAPPAPTAPRAASTNEGGEGGEAGKPVAEASIRVDTTKLDALVDAVGELVIAQTMVNLSDLVRTDEKLSRNVSQVTKIVRDIQEKSMAMRMVPIGPTLQKMKRLVRDVARKAGKQVDLVISGEETELDKNVIQSISDPLVHMVRNAVDHGLEPPAQRTALGKPDTGVVGLHAYYQGDTIVIEVRDDGRGMDVEKIRAKGIERGIITADQQLTQQQIYQLVFAPGFSTAEKITDISGRGVGMDVVKRNIEALRGRVDISTELGKGSVFSIRLPLTLAIIDGMLVRAGVERMIIPTKMIEQSLRPERKQITRVQLKGEMLQVRGELIPLVQLGNLFGYGAAVDPCAALVVVTQTETQKIGIVVEELIGQQQVVIKALDDHFKMVRGVSGAAILGDGRVGLILEPTRLLDLHKSSQSKNLEDWGAKPASAAPTSAPKAELAQVG